jgi:hypothetical protein
VTELTEEAGVKTTSKGIVVDATLRNPISGRRVMWRANTSSPMLLLNKGNQRLSLHENERAIMKGETQGFVKLLVDTKGKILGGHILASSGDDLLAPIVLAMQANIPVSTLASTLLLLSLDMSYRAHLSKVS